MPTGKKNNKPTFNAPKPTLKDSDFFASQDLTGLPSKDSFKEKFQAKDAETLATKNNTLERSYLRLTEKVDSNDMRTLEQLKASFNFTTKSVGDKSKALLWGVDQLRMIRQELTVLNIKNKFSLKVYFESFR
jgi:hypothetical protein